MKIEKITTSNWENAFRGLRNPMDSWDRSDSHFGMMETDWNDVEFEIASKYFQKNHPTIELYGDAYYDVPDNIYEKEMEAYDQWLIKNGVIDSNTDSSTYFGVYIGPNDLDLAQRMIAGGEPNDKFLRQIFVSMDITAPLYLWKEIDTYKVGTTANSCSTMHKIQSYPITMESFELDDFCPRLLLYPGDGIQRPIGTEDMAELIVKYMERLRQLYLETKNIRYWKELIRWLPEGWLQKRTWTGDYCTLRHMWRWRHNHKLSEWHTICDAIEQLPYAKELILYKNGPDSIDEDGPILDK